MNRLYPGQAVRYVSQNPLLAKNFPSSTCAPVCAGVFAPAIGTTGLACLYAGSASVPTFSYASFGYR